MRILAISGSLQAESSNRTLLGIAAELAPVGVELHGFEGIADLPHFDPDLDRPDVLPASVERWRQALSQSDAVLIASPEYGRSLPGVVKNAIEWTIGSGELHQKIVAITAAVPAPERGQQGLKALRDTLASVSATIVGGQPIAKGATFEHEIGALVQALITTVEHQRTTQ
jgi:chromate reductase, NAD(P)H dehydrogenase (quinone)